MSKHSSPYSSARRRWLQTWLGACMGSLVAPRLLAQNPKSGEDDVLRLTTELVLVNVTVMDGQGNYVRGLRQEDFRIFQDGVAQRIEHFSAENAPFCAAIMIDASDSMRTKLRAARAAAAHFQSLIRADDAVAVYTFGSEVERVQDFSSARMVNPRLWELRARGRTRLYDGLRVVIEALDARPEQRRAIVLISDGADTASDTRPPAVIHAAAQADVLVYAIDLHDPQFPGRYPAEVRHAAWLAELATTTGGRYIRSPGGAHLETHFGAIVEELRAQYTIGFYPPQGYDGLTHEIRVLVRRPNVTWRARKSYT
ncbi:MAG: VWA domain-containing protein [Chloracidobacterium sp.]